MKNKILLFGLLALPSLGYAQEHFHNSDQVIVADSLKKYSNILNAMQKLKVSGYMQTQFQYGEKDASLKVGAANENNDKSFNRIGIRRGRIKFVYEEGITSATIQLDITEKGVSIKDAFIHLKDPWTGTNALRAGVFNRPFGYEIGYSSSQRESTERSTIFQTLFPDERDLGGMLVLQPAKTSPWNFLKLEAGLFAGNGIKQETDSKKDFIGHVSGKRNIGNTIQLGFGMSYYNGSVFQGTQNVYTMSGKSFVVDSLASNKGKYAKREYIGVDGQLSIKSTIGTTQLRGEYLFGTQPGNKTGSKSPNDSSLPTKDTYIRNFSGGYVILIQDFGASPISGVLKYDWYDPNTKISKNEIGQNGTDIGDLKYATTGFGLLWRVNNKTHLHAYYELVKNETTQHITGFEKDIKDNGFTFRLQYKF